MREPLWASAELRAALGAVTTRPWFADGVQIDSRAVLPGDVFIALKGSVVDGHDFVQEALRRGAASAIVGQQVKGLDFDDPRLTRVGDTTEALNTMAAYARDRAPADRIAVTGSVGKTSVVQALRAFFAEEGRVHASFKSYNNHVGVPLSLVRMARDTRIGVFELGMNAPGEISALSKMVQPHISVITTVGLAHRAGFDHEADIARAKAEILDGQGSGATAIIGLDHPFHMYLRRRAEQAGLNLITVSTKRPASVCLRHVDMTADSSFIVADIMGETVSVTLQQSGWAWIASALIMLAVVKAAGKDVGAAALTLSRMEAEPGRGRSHMILLNGCRISLIDDSYNANPDSMGAALGRLALYTGDRRRIALLGDMGELGDEAARAHDGLVPALKAAGLSHILSTGEHMSRAARAAGLASTHIDVGDALPALKEIAQDGDVLLIKGANSAGLGAVSGSLVTDRSLSSSAHKSALLASPAFGRSPQLSAPDHAKEFSHAL